MFYDIFRVVMIILLSVCSLLFAIIFILVIKFYKKSRNKIIVLQNGMSERQIQKRCIINAGCSFLYSLCMLALSLMYIANISIATIGMALFAFFVFLLLTEILFHKKLLSCQEIKHLFISGTIDG